MIRRHICFCMSAVLLTDVASNVQKNRIWVETRILDSLQCFHHQVHLLLLKEGRSARAHARH